MENNIQKLINENGIRLFLIDIDGTLKDLAKEHITAIEKLIDDKENIKNRKSVILFINNFLMEFVKSGLFPTNKHTQNLTCFVNSILFGEEYSKFKKEYITEYSMLDITFDNYYEMLKDIEYYGARYVLVSKNEQSINFLNKSGKFDSNKTTISYEKGNKLEAFKRSINRIENTHRSFIYSHQIVIIGDNLWDDIVPAILLKTRFLWCNKYESKTKKLCSFCLPKVSKKALHNTKEKSIW